MAMAQDTVRLNPMGGSSTIAMYLPSMEGGGTEMVFALLTHAFIDRGYRVTLVLNRREGPALERVHPAAKIHDLDAARGLTALPRLAHFLRRERPAALLSGLDVSNVIAVWARSIARVPTRSVVSVHALLSAQIERENTWQYRLLPRLLPHTYARCDAVVAVSEAVAKDLVSLTGLARTRITRIYNPLPVAIAHQARAPLMDPWCDSSPSPMILAVGRLAAEKDFVTLLRAFAMLLQRRAARLMILGEGPERGRLEGLVQSLGLESAVRMPGHIANPYPYMSKAALLVLSSVFEGFGLVLLEALACGTPVVSTDCRGGPAEILAGGAYGRLVPVGDPSTMAKAIEESLDARPPPHVLIERAKEFDLDTIAEQYLAVLIGGGSA